MDESDVKCSLLIIYAGRGGYYTSVIHLVFGMATGRVLTVNLVRLKKDAKKRAAAGHRPIGHPTTNVYTHVESVGLGPHVAIVAGDRGFGDAPGRQ